MENRVDKVERDVDELKKATESHATKIKDLKDYKHKHNNELHTLGLVTGMLKDAIDGLNKVVGKQSDTQFENTKQLVHIKAVAITIVFMGSAFASFIIFVGGKVLKWW